MAAYCLCAKHLNRATAIIAWLSTGFFIYRLSLSWVEWRLPCPCLGNFVELLHLSPRLADLEMKVLAAYMLAGSGFHLLRNLCRNAGAKPGSYNRPLTSNTALN
jgi:hypothetical protein